MFVHFPYNLSCSSVEIVSGAPARERFLTVHVFFHSATKEPMVLNGMLNPLDIAQ